MKMLALGVKDHQLSVLHVQLTQDKFKSKQSPSLPTADSSTIYVVTMDIHYTTTTAGVVYKKIRIPRPR